MRSTLKPYFLDGCDEDLRRRYLPYFKQRFAATGKKDGFKAWWGSNPSRLKNQESLPLREAFILQIFTYKSIID